MRDIKRPVAPYFTQFHFRQQARDGYVIETWLHAGRFAVNGPVSFYVRLTSPDKAVSLLPKTKVIATITSLDGKATRTADFEPIFEECAKMKKRIEITLDEHGIEGPEKEFPPLGPCWEALIADPFDSNLKTRFSEGFYLLKVVVSLDKGPTIVFDDLRLEFYSRLKR